MGTSFISHFNDSGISYEIIVAEISEQTVIRTLTYYECIEKRLFIYQCKAARFSAPAINAGLQFIRNIEMFITAAGEGPRGDSVESVDGLNSLF